jgi:hypothetical protein
MSALIELLIAALFPVPPICLPTLGFAAAGGLLWIASGVAFAGAGLGLFGMPALRSIWQPLALTGGGLGLAALVVFFHPLYALALLINLAVLATRAGTERSPFTLAGA